MAAVATVQYRRWRVPVGAQCCVHVQWVSGARRVDIFHSKFPKFWITTRVHSRPCLSQIDEWLYHVPLRSLTVGMEKPCPAARPRGRAGRARRTQPATNALRHRRALVRSLRTREERSHAAQRRCPRAVQDDQDCPTFRGSPATPCTSSAATRQGGSTTLTHAT